VRSLTMTDEEYTVIERELKGRLGHQEDLGFSGSGAKHALGILERAEEVPQEPCAFYLCDKTAPAEEDYCPAHADAVQRVVASMSESA
jgi:hypothetical protein